MVLNRIRVSPPDSTSYYPLLSMSLVLPQVVLHEYCPSSPPFLYFPCKNAVNIRMLLAINSYEPKKRRFFSLQHKFERMITECDNSAYIGVREASLSRGDMSVGSRA